MVKNIVRHGNTHAIILDRTLLELAGLTPESLVSLTVEKNRIIIRRSKQQVLPPLTRVERGLLRNVS